MNNNRSLPKRTDMYHKTRTYLFPALLLCSILPIMISGCSKNKEADLALNSNLATSNPTSTLLLAWIAPTNYTNGDVLAETDIKEYKVYYSTSHITQPTGSFYSVSDPTSSLTPTTVKVKDIISQATGTFYFVVTAVDKTYGQESDASNEVSREIQ